MSKLQKKLDEDFKKYFKERETEAVSALKMVRSEIKNREIEKGEELTDKEVLKILKDQVKSRKDSIEQFKKANRNDLITKEEKEIRIIQKYLPEEMPEAEIEKIVKAVIKQTKAQSKADIGKVMPLAMQETKGRADGALVKEIVLKNLN
ncbi:MAG: GatB/YqeY domain-containing protein [Candidatus Moranbacteria bacterium]|nr:GatB/YqeY domain-containing protein [Candidatus Moranbacteria bacterium]